MFTQEIFPSLKRVYKTATLRKRRMKKTTRRQARAHAHTRRQSYIHTNTQERRRTRKSKERERVGETRFFFLLLLHLLRLTNRHCHCRYDSFRFSSTSTADTAPSTGLISFLINSTCSQVALCFFVASILSIFCDVVVVVAVRFSWGRGVSLKEVVKRVRKKRVGQEKTKDLTKIDNKKNFLPVLFCLLVLALHQSDQRFTILTHRQ
jgi:hypothetical protein